ncbi:uracil-DNA glycosylase [Methylobacterium sp. C25]|uniref:uracil-DNA glycosylase n=1 Tax=Methylobacterium sp. C25 TaxID=2721622 RepID=UPI001F1BB880|nr:uracil-DNA glycosylase [Methylobacterium sp. C25]MCE4224980.1 uracil-DNA glycosylase [Methylobacterium sp. C25]
MTENLLDNSAAIVERLAGLGSPHVAALETYAKALRHTYGEVPHFDPFDGGIDARLLFLLSTPGPSSAAIRFTSRDNPTGTARTLRRLFAVSRVSRRDTVLWNAVPWTLPRRGRALGLPSSRDRAAARVILPDLLDLMPRLEAVVLLGAVAGALAEQVRERVAAVLTAPHPSPANLAADRSAFGRLEQAFTEAAALCRTEGATDLRLEH